MNRNNLNLTAVLNVSSQMSFIQEKCVLFTVLFSYEFTEGVSRIVFVYFIIFHPLLRKMCKQSSISIAIPGKMAYAIFTKFYILDSCNQICGKCHILMKTEK